MTTKGVLNKQDYETLKRAQRIVHDVRPMLDDAESCGVDCKMHRQIADDFYKLLEDIQRRFLTPAPKV